MANIFVTGMTGTGKTTFVGKLLKEIGIPVYAFSNKEEDADLIEKESGLTFTRVYLNESTQLKYLPDKNIFFIWAMITHDKRIEFIDKFSILARSRNNRIIYVDEVHLVLPNVSKHSRELEALIAGGRIKSIHSILVTQRPQDIRKGVLNNCKWKVTFKLNEPNAIKAMVENMQNITENDIQNLQLYECFIYNAYSGILSKSVSA